MTKKDGVIYYNIKQQDDSLVLMTVADTPDMERFVRWVEAFEGQEDESKGLHV